MKLIRCDESYARQILAIFNDAILTSTALYEYKPLVRTFVEARARDLARREDAAIALEDLRREPAAAIFARAHAGPRTSEEAALFTSVAYRGRVIVVAANGVRTYLRGIGRIYSCVRNRLRPLRGRSSPTPRSPTVPALDPTAADLLFHEAHTADRFAPDPVPDELIERVWDLIRWGPTSGNASPGRFLLVRSPGARG